MATKGSGSTQSEISALLMATTILMIDSDTVLNDFPSLPEGRTIVYTHKDLLSAGLLASVAPDVVVAPLIARNWDILDIAEALEHLGYRKTLLVASGPLPRAHLVMSEVRAVCPGVDLHLLQA